MSIFSKENIKAIQEPKKENPVIPACIDCAYANIKPDDYVTCSNETVNHEVVFAQIPVPSPYPFSVSIGAMKYKKTFGCIHFKIKGITDNDQ